MINKSILVLYATLATFSLPNITLYGLRSDSIKDVKTEFTKLRRFDLLGRKYEANGDKHQALQTYLTALAYNPNFIETRFAKKGNLPNAQPRSAHIIDRIPEWNGQPLKKKSILIYSEKGLGDTIQFSRFLRDFAQQHNPRKIKFITNKHLKDLIKNSFSGIRNFYVIDESTNIARMKFDYQASLLSLPHKLGVSLNECKKSTSYLKVPNKKRFAKIKEFNNDKLKVGIIWQGNPNHINDKARSVDLKLFHSLAKIPGVQFYSLQKFTGREQLKAWPKKFPIIDLDQRISTWQDTTDLITHLDLTICIDSAVAHLSGALNKKTWLLLPHITDWRWLGFSENSSDIWYNNLTKFQRASKENWEMLFKRIQRELSKLAQERLSKKK